MTALLRRPTGLFSLSALLIAMLLAGGCASDDIPRPNPAARRRPFPPVAGQADFFSGAITAEVRVGALAGFDRDAPAGGGENGSRRGHGGMRVRGISGMRDGAPVGLGGSPGGPPPGGDEAPVDGERTRALAARRADAQSSPPVMIHLRFTNHGNSRVDVVIADFLSPLGNFVVRPEKLTLEPGAAAEVEPMTSRLAGEITSGEITLNLRLGAASETRTIVLAPAPPEPVEPQL